ncbi:Fanconi anemia group F protein - like 1 [Theobroma cacao]|nr:Fanconi anemia group F protein - like 1 [Theobroma cacao]
MGWNYPDISLEEMMKLIKGFVDILILASGYQSSGLLAHWDSDNIKRAFHWALFFENVFRRLRSLDVYRESLEELDAALFEMASHPSFPQGLAHLSSATLRRARGYMLEHLLHNLPLRDSHLKAILTSTIEMDLSALSETEHDCLNAYLNKLTLQNRLCMGNLFTSSLDVTPTMETEDSGSDNFTKLAVQELFRRQSAVSCISTIEEGVNILSNAVRQSSWTESDCSLFREKMKHESLPALLQSADASVAVFTWNQWKSRALSYFLDKRTIRLVSGASLIFSGTKVQWGKVFGQLNFSEKDSNCDIHEAIFLLLCLCYVFGCHVIMSIYMLQVAAMLVWEAGEEAGILDFLMGLLGGQVHLLWKSSPALTAISLPSWSPLFRLYLSEIDTQFKGNPSTMRFGIYAAVVFKIGMSIKTIIVPMAYQNLNHVYVMKATSITSANDIGELAERIWCLYIFHVCGAQMIHGTCGA